MEADNDNELPRTRAEARDAGSKHYFTGKPCKHGHVEKRFTGDGGCAECKRASVRKRYAANPEKARERVRRRNAANPEIGRERERKRRKENPEGVKAAILKWNLANPGKRNKIEREGAARRRAANPEPERERQRKWRQDNPDKVKANKRKTYEKKRKEPKFRLEEAVRSGMRKGLRLGSKASRKTFSLLGYSVTDLMEHLERQFQQGMTWQNYGRNGWHIDHKIPLSAHNYNTPDDIDFKRAWALSNLQPLWEPENISKSAKLTAPFQPSLALAV